MWRVQGKVNQLEDSGSGKVDRTKKGGAVGDL